MPFGYARHTHCSRLACHVVYAFGLCCVMLVCNVSFFRFIEFGVVSCDKQSLGCVADPLCLTIINIVPA